MTKKIFFYIFLSIVILNNQLHSEEKIYIAYKINNEIITNIDIQNESKYLIALNNQLKNLDKNKILQIAGDSIIKETIKKIEILKFYKLNQENEYIESIIKNFYLRLNLNNELEFTQYLKEYDLTTDEVREKIEIETVWNQMIFDKYKNQIKINMDELKRKLNLKKMSANKTVFLLSEIVFEKDQVQSINLKIEKINESIVEIGFKNSDNIYSISDSAKFGGDIGWVDEKNLSTKISENIKSLKIGDTTSPIQNGKSFLILKLEDLKNEKIEIDEKKELEKMQIFEQNAQLGKFSKMFFNKIKINTRISEL